MKALVKDLLRRTGYHAFKEGFLPKGVYLESDLRRVINLNAVTSVMDVGACEGKMTGHFLKIFPNARLIAIEPSPQSYNVIRKTYADTLRVETRQLGAARENGTIELTLFEDRELNTFKSIEGESESSIGSMVVEVKTIADILQTSAFNLDELDFVKIDVEGLEMDCLEGSGSLLRANKIGMVFIEAGFSGDDERHTPFAKIHEFLARFGFVFHGLYDLYHYRRPTELLFANALFLNERYLQQRGH